MNTIFCKLIQILTKFWIFFQSFATFSTFLESEYNFCTFFPRYNKAKKVGKRHLCEHKLVDIKRKSAFHNIGGPDSVKTLRIIGLNYILLATTIKIGKSNKIGLQLNTIFCKLIQFFAN